MEALRQVSELDIKVQVWNIDINLEVSWISKDFLNLNIKAQMTSIMIHDIEADDSDINIVKT